MRNYRCTRPWELESHLGHIKVKPNSNLNFRITELFQSNLPLPLNQVIYRSGSGLQWQKPISRAISIVITDERKGHDRI